MAHWLLKTEPSDYSFADLQRAKRVAWSGIKNAAALLNLRKMAVGDEVLLYHTGSEKAIVGLAKIVRAAYTEKGADPKSVVVDLAAGEKLPQPVLLAQIKADPRFKDWALVKIGRLSVVPTTAEQFAAVVRMAGS